MRTLAASLLILVAAGAVVAAPEGYHLDKTFPVPGDGGWDYLTVDAAARRVYVSHATQVDVLNADSGEVTGTISNTPGVHGIAVAPDLGRGFISNGRADTVAIFDLKTLKRIGDDVATGKGPDAILYDPSSKRVFAFCGHGNSATVIDAAEGKVLGTIDLGGAPEFGVADGSGNVFVNLEDKDILLKIDAKKMTVLERWPLAPGKTPTGLAMDVKGGQLFVGCRSKVAIVLSAETGKVIADLPIGDRVDAAAFDPETGTAFFSCGDGTVTAIQADKEGKYTVTQTIKTKPGSKTMALDLKTHDLFLPAADFKPAPAGGANNPRQRPSMIPGTFAVLRFSK
jgi:DNA-binding beta-propeller fold protein YncE